jgi:hypothetical protein
MPGKWPHVYIDRPRASLEFPGYAPDRTDAYRRESGVWVMALDTRGKCAWICCAYKLDS